MVLITNSNIGGETRAVSGSAQQGAVGDVWKLDLRGSFSDNVATSTTFLFRQNDSYDPNINVAQQLVDDFSADPGGPLQPLLFMCSSRVEYVCAIVTNLAIENSLAETFSLSGAEGQVPIEIMATIATTNIKYQDDTGNAGRLKTMYIPAPIQTFIVNGVLTDGQIGAGFNFIDQLYNFGGVGGVNWSWVYGLVDGNYERANGAFVDPFVGRLYSRNPSLC